MILKFARGNIEEKMACRQRLVLGLCRSTVTLPLFDSLAGDGISVKGAPESSEEDVSGGWDWDSRGSLDPCQQEG